MQKTTRDSQCSPTIFSYTLVRKASVEFFKAVELIPDLTGSQISINIANVSQESRTE
jgi:hypothetical protein